MSDHHLQKSATAIKKDSKGNTEAISYSSGSVPSAHEMKVYSEISEDFPKYFMERSKEEQLHRHRMDRFNSNAGVVTLILLIGLIVGLALMGERALAGAVIACIVSFATIVFLKVVPPKK